MRHFHIAETTVTLPARLDLDSTLSPAALHPRKSLTGKGRSEIREWSAGGWGESGRTHSDASQEWSSGCRCQKDRRPLP